MAVSAIFGAKVNRREDPRLVTGTGIYANDVVLPNLAYAVFLRSPRAHAKIKNIDTDRAKRLPGVIAILTGKDIGAQLNPVPCAWPVTGADVKVPKYFPIALDKVRYVGDPVAVVVATSPYEATDALEAIEVEYEPLPAVVNQEEACKPGAAQLYDDVPNNIALHWKVTGGNVSDAFSNAEVTIKERFVNQRLQPTALETRGATARYDPSSDTVTMWITTQNPHIHRLLLSLMTGIPEHKLRIISKDVGGGFGSKIPCYGPEAVIAFLAKKTNIPIKWTEDRQENYLATIHGRDHVQHVELAGKKDGTITGLKVLSYANMGAWLSTAAPGIPTILFGLILPGAYKIPNVECEVYGIMTNTTGVDAYRGAGRPEATYIIERLVDIFAHKIGMDPAELRMKNFISKEQFPYNTATGLAYDSGNYEGALMKALGMIGYDELRKEQQRLRAEGKLVGIGISSYVEVCGLGPSAVVRSTGFALGLWESAIVRVHPSGKVSVFTGGHPHGQGEETTFAQIAASELGVPIEDVDVIHGDTDRIPFGMGTYGSRTTPVAGGSIVVACRRIRDKGRRIAAHLLEAREEDIVFDTGKFFVKGSPGTSKSMAEVAWASYGAGGTEIPTGMEPGLESTAFYDPPSFVFPFGTHICSVEVDRESGQIKIKRYVAVDDCGRQVNPMIVEGQVHGGIAQGIAQALWEEAIYDSNGNLLTGTLSDYAVPSAAELPRYETSSTETPSPYHPLGLKGVGETGTIASTPAVVNAVCDALSPFGIENIDMPLRSDKIWRILKEKGASQ